MPKISVLMSVCNEKNDFLKLSVDSILNQAFNDFELIIVNDYTNNENFDILSSYEKKDSRIKLINNKKNLGLTKSLNKGLSICSGKYISRMDSDDVAKPEKLLTQIEWLEKNPDYIGCGTDVVYINEQGKKIKKKDSIKNYKDIKKSIIRYNSFIHPTLLIKKEFLDKVNGYDENFVLAQDYELILRLLSNYKLEILPGKLLHYRINKTGLSYQGMKRSLKYALKARWKALTKMNYPKWQIIYLAKPLLSYLFPIKLKLLILNFLHKS